MIKPIPAYSIEDNSVYNYASEKYKIKIVIDELNDNLLLPFSLDLSEYTCCTCKDYLFRKHNCKHIKEVLDYLKSAGIDYREENELPTEE